ncbi:MAG: response regulator transcription factor [Treponema sp.]|nr:response regulator transcription factor [Treponema sp.]
MQTVYIVEDDKNISEIEFFTLKNAGFDPVCFYENTSFQKAMEQKLPSIVILDIMLPGTDGISILKKIRTQEHTKNLPVIMVTAKASEIDTVKALDYGADDYITKPFGLMELVSRVKAVLRRGILSTSKSESSTPISLGKIKIDVKSRTVTISNNPIELTFKEFELLLLLIQNKGNVLTREFLLDKIWNTSPDIESRTVDMHIKTLRKKLEAEGNRIVTVRNVGYKAV